MTNANRVTIASLNPTDWIRLSTGEVGVIRDKLEQPGYRKACVEVPSARYPIHILHLETLVEHLPEHQP